MFSPSAAKRFRVFSFGQQSRIWCKRILVPDKVYRVVDEQQQQQHRNDITTHLASSHTPRASPSRWAVAFAPGLHAAVKNSSNPATLYGRKGGRVLSHKDSDTTSAARMTGWAPPVAGPGLASLGGRGWGEETDVDWKS
ncbi:hypothetical protein S40285_10518 [Stachybotrys chlorohalonatus IBT 40285]|uniref:Uncharacterized protein n=1 Tax=Stachybotrys chlorohalonatus (strain IBT 40285) TaxID=1283841 RepID=A0A084Q8C3_STAC4|nr:hypothetical protein S40285_10518 [Stachybotrys chlorohalonata IBT 40285]